MTHKSIPGPFGSFDADLLKRVDDLFIAENLTQTILHAHLLIEQAIEKKLQKKLARPEVLNNKRFASLSFSQKVSIYTGLYDPEDIYVDILLGFNKLRNMIAHQLVSESDAVLKCLPEKIVKMNSDSISMVKAAFGILILAELDALHGLERLHKPNFKEISITDE